MIAQFKNCLITQIPEAAGLIPNSFTFDRYHNPGRYPRSLLL
jgi:hypothetical protein